jgi:hypothetical protein
VANSGPEATERLGLDDWRGGVQQVVVAAMLRREEAHQLVRPHRVLGDLALAQQLAAEVVRLRIAGLGMQLEPSAVHRRQEVVSELALVDVAR